MAQYNPIPQPTNDPTQLRLSVQALKEAFEILTGQRGSGTAAAALKSDIEGALILRGYIAGLTLSTAGSSTTFSVAAGVATDSTSVDYLSLVTPLSKTTGAWAAGTGLGSLDTGAVAASTWYHVFLIKRPDTGQVDVLTSLSATSPALPAAYTVFRRIGSLLTNSSSQWSLFTQVGDEFHFSTNAVDVNGVTPGSTAAQLASLTVPPSVSVVALFHAGLASGPSGNNAVLFSSPDEADVAPFGATGGNNADLWALAGSGAFTYGSFQRRTNTSQQIRYRVTSVASGARVWIYTYGYIDRRGRDD